MSKAEIVKHHVESLVNADVMSADANVASRQVDRARAGSASAVGLTSRSSGYTSDPSVAARRHGSERVRDSAWGPTPKIISHQGGQRNSDPIGSQLRYDSRGANDRTLKLYDGFWDQLVNEQDNETSSRSV